jgi:NAD(P)-dependent dehydrogenase (short-subunit alcohol dehydrogenase family)
MPYPGGVNRVKENRLDRADGAGVRQAPCLDWTGAWRWSPARAVASVPPFGDVDDIAWAAVYLASDEAKFVTGQVLSPNGDWHMSQ